MNDAFDDAAKPGDPGRRRFLAALLATSLLPVSRTLAAAPETVVGPGDAVADAVAQAARSGAKTIRLEAGRYDSLQLAGIDGGGIELVGGKGVTVGPTTIRGCRGLRFRDVAFRGEAGPNAKAPALVQVLPDAGGVAFANCSFAAREDVSSWQAADWVSRPYPVGLWLRGPQARLRDCRFFNLRNCLGLAGDGSVVENCEFEAFGNDAIEFGANDLRISGNTIRGGFHTPGEPMHADGMQGFPAPNEGLYRNILIENNRVAFAGPGDYLQGISIFDGRWRNVHVVGNTVDVNAWNAIALFGVDGVVVENNRVSSTDPKIRNWIEVRASKSGRPSTGVVARNNVAPVFKLPQDALSSGNERRLR